jgi:nucleoside-diphosphate-sugar epimerase
MRLKIAPFPIGTRIGVVHGADVASAVCSALAQGELTRGKVYNLQGHTVSLWDLSSAYRRAGGSSPWLRLPVPFPYLLRFDDSLARRELGFAPRALASILEEWLSAAP